MLKSLGLTFLLGCLIVSPVQALNVAAVGDIMMANNYPDGTRLEDIDALQFVRPVFATSDLRFGDFTGTLYDGAQVADGKAPGPNRYIFRTPTRMARHLVAAGFSALNLANNHTRDFGRAGLNSTKDVLSKAGIQYSSKDGEIATFRAQGQTVAFIGVDFYPGSRSVVNTLPTYLEIRELKRTYNLVVVLAHIGAEGLDAVHTPNRTEIYLGENRGNSIAFGHEAIDAGADLILMSGHHVPRGLELYNGHLIAYGLGNFWTEKGISIEATTGLAPVLQVELDRQGKFVYGLITSFIQLRGRPLTPDPQQRAGQLMAQLSTADFPDSAPVFTSAGAFVPSSGSQTKSR